MILSYCIIAISLLPVCKEIGNDLFTFIPFTCIITYLILVFPIVMSPPHKIRRHSAFSSVVCLSVRPSVCLSVLSRFRVHSISFEPLVRFSNTSAQMS